MENNLHCHLLEQQKQNNYPIYIYTHTFSPALILMYFFTVVPISQPAKDLTQEMFQALKDWGPYTNTLPGTSDFPELWTNNFLYY